MIYELLAADQIERGKWYHSTQHAPAPCIDVVCIDPLSGKLWIGSIDPRADNWQPFVIAGIEFYWMLPNFPPL